MRKAITKDELETLRSKVTAALVTVDDSLRRSHDHSEYRKVCAYVLNNHRHAATVLSIIVERETTSLKEILTELRDRAMNRLLIEPKSV
jgi:hypothetical protein